MSAIDVVIMAAGKGTRMKSQRPKVLHTLAGRPLLGHVLDSAAALGARSAIVVTGHGAPEVEAFCADWESASGRNRTAITPQPVPSCGSWRTGCGVIAVPFRPPALAQSAQNASTSGAPWPVTTIAERAPSAAALSSTCASKGRPASRCSTFGIRLFMRVPLPAAMMTTSIALIDVPPW